MPESGCLVLGIRWHGFWSDATKMFSTGMTRRGKIVTREDAKWKGINHGRGGMHGRD